MKRLQTPDLAIPRVLHPVSVHLFLPLPSYFLLIILTALFSGQMDLRAILSRQAAKNKAGSSSRVIPAQVTPQTEEQPNPLRNSPALSSASAATPPDSAAIDRKRKRTLIPTPEVVVLPSSLSEKEKNQPRETSSARSPVSPPRYPREYTAETNLFTAGPSSLGFNILHSLGSAAEQKYLDSCKLKTSTLEGCNELLRGLMRVMHGLDRTAVLRNEALSEAEEDRARLKAVSRELAEFKEIHSAIVDSLKAECDRMKAEVTEHKVAADSARAEAETAREELLIFKAAEAERQATFLKSREFQEILGPKAFKFLTIGLQSCKDQFVEAGLVSLDTVTDLPDLDKAIASVPDDILEDAPEDQAGRDEAL